MSARRPGPGGIAPLRHSGRCVRRSTRGRVVLAERLGRNIELTVDIGGTQLVVLAEGRGGVGEGAEVTLTVADADVHLFAIGEGSTPSLRTSGQEPVLEAAQ